MLGGIDQHIPPRTELPTKGVAPAPRIYAAESSCGDTGGWKIFTDIVVVNGSLSVLERGPGGLVSGVSTPDRSQLQGFKLEG